MSIRIATLEDLDLIISMAKKFLETTNYSKFVDEEVLKNVVTTIITGPRELGIVLLFEDKGMLAAVIRPFAYGNISMAYELGWWVEPEHRGSRIGKELKEAYEFWAQRVNAKLIMMVALDDSIASLYEKQGYKLMEYTYSKELE